MLLIRRVSWSGREDQKEKQHHQNQVNFDEM